MTQEHSPFSELLPRELDALKVPEGDMRRLVAVLAEAMDHPDRPGHMVAAFRAWEALWASLHELYAPRTPLQDQLAYERGRRELVAKGFELPRWDELPEDQRYGPSNEPST